MDTVQLAPTRSHYNYCKDCTYYRMSHKNCPGQNKKNRVQESVIVEESSTITITWTLFMIA